MAIMRLIGNIVTGNARQTQLVMECDFVKYLKIFLSHEKNSIRKESCWILSNLSCGTNYQLRCVIENGFLPLFIKILKNDLREVKK